MAQACFIYNADVYCESCGRAIRKRIKAEGNSPACPHDETTYDSSEYPKGPVDADESDSPQHCGSGADCTEAIELSDGRKIGAFLENPLTSLGLLYVACNVRGNPRSEVVKLWADFYSQELSQLEGSEDD